MNPFRIIILSLFFFMSMSSTRACSCHQLYFCEYLKGPDKKVVVKVRVGNYKEYSDANTAVYLEVLKVFRDDVGITSIIKLYGSNECCLCMLDFRYRFKVNSILYLAIGLEYNNQDAGYSIVNPDAIYEDFWEFYPSSCLTILLAETESRISGSIAEGIAEYPASIFEERLENCDYSLDELQEYQCMDTDYIVYPNPSEDGTIYISNNYYYSAINRIQIFDTGGKLVYTEDFEQTDYQRTKIEFIHSGFYIIAFTCAHETFYKKIIVE